ncbi:hypothetical protein HN014_17515 [Aquimarina sp. TRL1]|uniref:M12 family metallopeptidase n=1 Tax=Aquimarina sp. (strain TRL1) TaxID=2736252 RepID=UPI00158D4F3F|nr:M12 family metallopeptidase [Aquimarina sp. TRL1]QKX06635.1 hypothetical protein HN014_17515 [Aquimarina sp. TRL1]
MFLKIKIGLLISLGIISSLEGQTSETSVEKEEEASNAYQGFCTEMPSFTTGQLIHFAMDKKIQKDAITAGYKNSWSTFYNWRKRNVTPEKGVAVMMEEYQKEVMKEEDISEVYKTMYQLKAVILNDQIWNKNKLKVRFIDGDKNNIKRVIKYAREWERYCNVRFRFIERGMADITITFEDEGYWSFIGSNSKDKVPSMSLSSIERENTANFRGIVLHEFGHALGLIHEHQGPAFTYEWNTEEVYAYYKDKHGWEEEETYNNVLYRYNFDQVTREDTTPFDPKSIMIYYIPKKLLKNTSHTFHRNNELSEKDKQFIRRKY